MNTHRNILLIAAVICLDVAFVAFMAIERVSDNAAGVIAESAETALVTNGGPEIAHLDELPVYGAPEPVMAVTPRRDRSAAVRRDVSSQPVHTAAVKRPARPAKQAPERNPSSAALAFKPTVITIRHTVDVPPESEVAASREEKRSFIASAVRKPWDVLKTIGSKFK